MGSRIAGYYCCLIGAPRDTILHFLQQWARAPRDMILPADQWDRAPRDMILHFLQQCARAMRDMILPDRCIAEWARATEI
jgi:hypothetical protein